MWWDHLFRLMLLFVPLLLVTIWRRACDHFGVSHLKCFHMFYWCRSDRPGTSQSNKIRKNLLKSVDKCTYAQAHLNFASHFLTWSCFVSVHIKLKVETKHFCRICIWMCTVERSKTKSSFIVHDTEFFVPDRGNISNSSGLRQKVNTVNVQTS